MLGPLPAPAPPRAPLPHAGGLAGLSLPGPQAPCHRQRLHVTRTGPVTADSPRTERHIRKQAPAPGGTRVLALNELCVDVGGKRSLLCCPKASAKETWSKSNSALRNSV